MSISLKYDYLLKVKIRTIETNEQKWERVFFLLSLLFIEIIWIFCVNVFAVVFFLIPNEKKKLFACAIIVVLIVCENMF